MYVVDVQYGYGDPMSGGVLELGSCRASTAIISIRSCVRVMRFLVFLTGLDTAEHCVYHHPCIEHHRRIQKAKYSGHGIGAARACLIFSIMRYPVSVPHLLEYSSESLSCMLVANPINFSSGRRSTPSDFSLPLFFLFFLRSAI